MREREKILIASLLKSLSFVRDNTYHLHRHIWNDVHEDWPFYTEQDRQSLKRCENLIGFQLEFLNFSLFFSKLPFLRRKPQNLTPPLSSDGGSSTSGQSPTSTHNGSPPPAVKRPPLNSDKYLDGPLIKKQRISHYKKEVVNQDNNTRSTKMHSTCPLYNSDDNPAILHYRRSLVDTRETVNNLNSRARGDVDELPMRSSNYYG